MRMVRLLSCVVYALLLTVVLLAPHPAEVVGMRRIPEFPWGDVGLHFAAFTILSLLMHGLRWPARMGWPVLAALLAYALATETLQFLVPTRAVEFLDYVENLLGVAAGTGIYWLACHLLPRRRHDAGNATPGKRAQMAVEGSVD